MPSKHKTSAADVSTAKRKKKVMSLSHKVELLDQLLRGQSVASVDGLYGINEHTICYRRKNEKVIQKSVVASAVPSTKVAPTSEMST